MNNLEEFDFFDVETGKTTLEDYLQQRYNANDLLTPIPLDQAPQLEEVTTQSPTPEQPPAINSESKPNSFSTPPSLEELISKFHEAAAEYQRRNDFIQDQSSTDI